MGYLRKFKIGMMICLILIYVKLIEDSIKIKDEKYSVN